MIASSKRRFDTLTDDLRALLPSKRSPVEAARAAIRAEEAARMADLSGLGSRSTP